MKKYFLKLFILLCVFTLLFSGCQQASKKEGDTKMQKILIIGNSHSVDAFHLLPMAYKDQYPDKEIILGVAYYSGCSISQHNDFAKNEETVYRYYKNINNSWNIDSNVSMKQMLQDQECDR